MADAARKDLHDLVDSLPVSSVAQARKLLELLKLGPGERAARDTRERQLIDEHLDELNAESEDVLKYQADW